MADRWCFLYVPGDERLQERAERFKKVTDVFRSSEVRPRRQVALVSWDGQHIEAVAVMTVSGQVASYKTRVRLSDFFDGISVELAELARRLPKAARDQFRDSLGGGQLEPETTAAVRKVITEHYPGAAQAWELADAETQRQPPDLWPDEGVPVVAYERDAVGLALSIAGISRGDVISHWDGDTEAPFLKGIVDFRVYEDASVFHDTTVFGKWKGMGPSVIGVAHFEGDGGRKLTIINANRTPIENTLGCDLIYYVHDYDAYLLVQYKRLTKAATGWTFRPDGDANFEEELNRMRAIAAPAKAKQDPEHYRMGENFCFIKFCRPVTNEPFSGELSSGMYLPLDYFDRLVNAGRLKGPRGGSMLTYENVGRWLSNTAFVGLVERSWVGARGMTAKQLEAVLRHSLAAKHSLILAEGVAARPRPRPR